MGLRLRIGILGLLACWLPHPVCAHPGAHHDIERVSKLIEAEPQRAGLWIERAHHRRLAGEFEEALKDLNEAERLSPDTWDIVAHRGLTLARMGKNIEAESELTRFLENTSGTATAYVERARIRHAAGRVELAIADLSSSLALSQDALSQDIEVYLQRGEWQESLSRWDDAAEGYREALNLFGPIRSLQRAMVRVEMSRGNHSSALEIIDQAMAGTHSKVPWRLQRAVVLESAGQDTDARRERLTALDETNRVLERRVTAIQLVQRAEVFLALNEQSKARRDLELASKKSPRYPMANELLKKLNQSNR